MTLCFSKSYKQCEFFCIDFHLDKVTFSRLEGGEGLEEMVEDILLLLLLHSPTPPPSLLPPPDTLFHQGRRDLGNTGSSLNYKISMLVYVAKCFLVVKQLCPLRHF